VASQKCLNFWTKRNSKIQDKMGCNGLGNRCSIRLSYGTGWELVFFTPYK